MKSIFLKVTGLLASALFAGLVSAQSFPTRPITLVVPFPPGGATDAIARALADKIRVPLRQEVIIDNRPGAASLVALQYLRRQPPDGHTVVLMSTTITTLPSLNKAADYSVRKDFTPIAPAGEGSMMLMVNSETGIKTVADLIKEAKVNKKMTWGLASTLGFDHLAAVRIMRASGVTIETVGYKGSAPLTLDLLANRIQVVIGGSMDLYAEHIRSGRLTLLAVSSEKRYSEFPNAPTLMESGLKDSVISLWFGVFGPAGVPPAAVEILNREINAAMQTPELSGRLDKLGYKPLILNPSQFAQLAYDSERSWAESIKAIGIQPQ